MVRTAQCDGARPSCERCTNLGVKCGYVLDHKAVRTQLRKLQKEGLLPESIPLGRGNFKSHSAPDPSMAVPIPLAVTLSCPARMVAPEGLPGAGFPGQTADGASGASEHPGYVLSQAPPQSWARAPKRTGALPQRLTVPMLSSGSSSSSSSGNTPLATPTEEGPTQMGAMPNGFSVLFGPPGAPPKHGAYKQTMLSPNYPQPVMPFPGRSFPLVTTTGEYFDEARLVPELCGGVHNHIAIPANAYIVPHGAVNPGIKAQTIWMDASVSGLRSESNGTVWAELFGRE